jgi:cell division initiation protein
MEKFSYEANGYNRNQVNQFVEEVITQTEGIIKRCKEQKNEIENLRQELEHYKNIETSLKDAIIRAEEAGDNIKRMAREESEMIVTDAKHNASRIVNEALLKAEKIEVQSERLQNNIKIFKRKLKLIVEQQMEVVDEIEVLDLDEK